MASYRLVNEQVRRNAIAAIEAADIGGDETLVVSIDAEEKKRTQQQNRYLWGVVYKTIADNDPGFFTGEQTAALLKNARLSVADVIHEFCKQCFLPPVHVAVGEGMVLSPSTTRMTRQDFNAYVEDIRRWAADSLGVYVPDPKACGYEDLMMRRGK